MFELTYRLTRPGWSEAVVADEQGPATLAASYLSDALFHLIEALALVVEGEAEARCSWKEEPGEFRWIFRREGEEITLRVFEFRNFQGPPPGDKGRLVFTTTQPAAGMGRVILSGCQRLLDDIGQDEYLRSWRRPWPVTALGGLGNGIRAATP